MKENEQKNVCSDGGAEPQQMLTRDLRALLALPASSCSSRNQASCSCRHFTGYHLLRVVDRGGGGTFVNETINQQLNVLFLVCSMTTTTMTMMMNSSESDDENSLHVGIRC